MCWLLWYCVGRTSFIYCVCALHRHNMVYIQNLINMYLYLAKDQRFFGHFILAKLSDTKSQFIKLYDSKNWYTTKCQMAFIVFFLLFGQRFRRRFFSSFCRKKCKPTNWDQSRIYCVLEIISETLCHYWILITAYGIAKIVLVPSILFVMPILNWCRFCLQCPNC